MLALWLVINLWVLPYFVGGTFDLAEVVRCFGEPGKQRETSILLSNGTEELERLRKEYAEYKRQATEREDWLKGQIDRMQTLLELK